jgi:hypothetical protein
MDGTGDHCVKWNKPDSERQISHVFFHKWTLEREQKNMKIEGGRLGKRKGFRERGKRGKVRVMGDVIKVHYVHIQKCHDEPRYFEYKQIKEERPLFLHHCSDSPN